MSCGAICGTGRMSKFLRRTPCAASEPGHRTLPPINQRESRKAEPQGVRGSGRSEDPHREATCGVGPVTGSAGSESRSDRGGRHPASSPEGLLVLIPSRGPHLASTWAGPAGPRVGTESRPACRTGRGSRFLPTVLPWGDSGNPDHRRFAGGDLGPGSQPVRRRRCRARSADRAPHRGATRGAGPVTGTVGAEHGLVGEVDVTTPPRPRGPLVLIPPGEPSHSDRPPACWWEVGAGQVRRSTLRGDSRRRPGDGDGGVGEPVRSRWASPLPPQPRRPLRLLIPSGGAFTFVR